MNRDDQDTLALRPGKWQVLRDLVWRRSLRRPGPVPPAQLVTASTLRLAFEYLAVECETAGRLLDDLAEPLAGKMVRLSGRARFDVQRKLADALRDQRPERFFLALHLATQLPVPQARSLLLHLLTRRDLSRWCFAGARVAGGQPAVFDLRAAVVAALGQLRDPSLLSLFHRLLERLPESVRGNDPVIAAVQWSLMNLAPGGQAEPMPMAMLSGRAASGRPDAEREGPLPTAKPQIGTADAVSGNGRANQLLEPVPAAPHCTTGSHERADLLADF